VLERHENVAGCSRPPASVVWLQELGSAQPSVRARQAGDGV